MNTNITDILEGKCFLHLPAHSLWSFTGADRVRYLNGQCTADASKLKPGESLWAAVLSLKARMEGDIRIAALSDRLLVDADSSLLEILGKRLAKYIIADDVKMEDVRAEWSIYHCLASELSEFQLPETALSFSSNRMGQAGTDVWIPSSEKPALPVGNESDWETLRISNGMPRWGVDMTQDNLPPEMPFFRFGGLSYSKGCYIGQEVVSRIKSIGHVNKELCLLHAEDNGLPALPVEVLSEDGKCVGKGTSACLSVHTGRPVMLATISRNSATTGTILKADAFTFRVERLLGDV